MKVKNIKNKLYNDNNFTNKSKESPSERNDIKYSINIKLIKSNKIIFTK